MLRLIKCIGICAVLVAVAACDPRANLSDPTKQEFGPFKLGHNITVARDPSVGPGSIPVTEAEWQAAMQNAIAERFGRYQGDRLYHFGISVDGYFLTSLDAAVPLVPSLKSVVLITVTLWDDALGRKLNAEAKEFAIISAFSGAGPFPTKERLLVGLTARAAQEIEAWMLENPQWFQPPFE